MMICNDIHSKLNPTQVSEVIFPSNEIEVIAAIKRAGMEGKAISICGGRHAMGGQQFGESTILLDMTRLDFVKTINRNEATVEAGAGIKWPSLISTLHDQQAGEEMILTIRQKQTGADDLTLGGALASNIHGRGLHMKPFVSDVQSFRIVDADGVARHCSRSENADLFSLAIGGYGCFGVVTSIVLRLSPRIRLRRIVEVTTLDRISEVLLDRIDKGCLYGDFQFSIDENSPDFLWKGVLSTYRPCESDLEIPELQESLGKARWEKLVRMAHDDRANIFAAYSGYYLSTHGNLYWSDTHQLSIYVNDYHRKLDTEKCPGSEMITELYVPHGRLIPFMKDAAEFLKKREIPVIYGTMRLIREDDESFLPWATEDFACVIFNLHTEHTAEGIAQAAEVFRALIDLAISYGGTYFLTYHRWATREQVEAAYPRFKEFMKMKLLRDPQELLKSDWWRCYREMFQLSSS